MADNLLTVVDATGNTRTLRSIDVGSAVQGQVIYVHEGPEIPVDPAGGLTRYTVDSSPAVALDAPTLPARYARVRVYETTALGNPPRRLYYRSDGTAPQAAGTNVFGYLLHGEMILVRLATMTNFSMIADATDGGVFQVYVEWLNSA